MEASRLTYSLKDKRRCTESNLRIQELNDSFARDVEKKLAEKMESTIEKKNSRIGVIQERLKEHVSKKSLSLSRRPICSCSTFSRALTLSLCCNKNSGRSILI